MGSPVVTPSITKYILLNTAISASELFSVVDPDGDAITRYRFIDSSSSAGSGFFRLNGTPQANGGTLFIAAAELSQLEFVAGSQVGSETITIAAKDGSAFGNNATMQIFFVRPNVNPPVVTARSVFLLQNESVSLSSLVTASDPDGWPLQRYFFRDTLAGTFSGRLMTAAGELAQATNHYLLPAAYDTLVYNARLGNEVERIFVQVFDGVQWSAATSFTITTRPNQNAPVAQFNRINVPVDRIRSIGDALPFFDADGNTIKSVQLFDTNPHSQSGNLRVNGVTQAAGQWITVNAADLPSLQYTGAKTDLAETIRFRVYDGRFWSNIQDLVLNNLVRPIVNYEPMVFRRELIAVPFFGGLVTKADSGPNYSWAEVIDLGLGVNSARFSVGSQTLAQGQIHRLTAQQMSQLQIRTGLFGGREFDTFLFRVNNGTFTSPWEKMEFRTEPSLEIVLRQPNGSPDEGFNDWDDYVNTRIVTYSFMTGFADHTTPDGASGDNFSSFTLAQRNGARTAFSYLEDLINVRFVEVSDFDTTAAGQGGMIRMGNYNNPPPDVGSGMFNGYTFSPQDLAETPGGDIWINVAFTSPAVGWQPSSSGFAYSTYLQLLAGAMGLVPAAVLGEVGSPRLSVGAQLGASGEALVSGGAGAIAPGHMMVFDIHALQALYGANMSTRTGDDVYSLSNTWFDDQNMFWTIWDAGGNDTLSAEGDNNGAVIDLREGEYSSIGNGVRNIGMAFNSKIENAMGSEFNDTINGNALNNVITANAGNDTIWGNAGNDMLMGGAGNDTYRYDFGDDDDTINEQRLGGLDRIVLSNFPTLDSFSADLTFRREFRDLIIDLTIDGGESDGSIRIKDQRWGASRVETLVFNGTNVDLSSVYDQTTTVSQSFRITTTAGAFGFLVAPV